jgi:hypothetical protein
VTDLVTNGKGAHSSKLSAREILLMCVCVCVPVSGCMYAMTYMLALV